jgi:hypothetical protein
MCNFFCGPLTSSFSRPNIRVSAMFSSTPNLCAFLRTINFHFYTKAELELEAKE